MPLEEGGSVNHACCAVGLPCCSRQHKAPHFCCTKTEEPSVAPVCGCPEGLKVPVRVFAAVVSGAFMSIFFLLGSTRIFCPATQSANHPTSRSVPHWLAGCRRFGGAAKLYSAQRCSFLSLSPEMFDDLNGVT